MIFTDNTIFVALGFILSITSSSALEQLMALPQLTLFSGLELSAKKPSPLVAELLLDSDASKSRMWKESSSAEPELSMMKLHRLVSLPVAY